MPFIMKDATSPMTKHIVTYWKNIGFLETEFYHKLHDPAYKEKAYEEFALVKQLKVTGFPTVFLQVSDTKFYLLNRGYTDYSTLKKNLEEALVQAVTERSEG